MQSPSVDKDSEMSGDNVQDQTRRKAEDNFFWNLSQFLESNRWGTPFPYKASPLITLTGIF